PGRTSPGAAGKLPSCRKGTAVPPDVELDALVHRIASAVAEHLRVEREALLDRRQLAERRGVGERTVGSMVSRSEWPPPILHTPGCARWDWQTVVRWLGERQGRKLRKGRGRFARVTEKQKEVVSCQAGGGVIPLDAPGR